MTSKPTFSKTVAVRTRTAKHIMLDRSLLELYERYGGLMADLQAIVEAGERAELLFAARGEAKADGSAATVDVLEAFAALKREYSIVMGVLQASILNLEADGARADTIALAKQILANESATIVRKIVKPGEKRTARSASQEAQRAEIRKDAAALVSATALHDVLAKRRVSVARLTALVNDADALAGKLAERVAMQGAEIEATEAISEAVRQQRRIWNACYRILTRVAEANQPVAALLAECSQAKRKQTAKPPAAPPTTASS